MQVNDQDHGPVPAFVPPGASTREEAPQGGGRLFDHIQGLDGLRAISVIGVLLYHASPAWVPGGFLGVEVFFVISGFLITGLLLKEYGRFGRIRIGQFLLRRARRLLPALFALLLCVIVYGWLFLGAESSQFRPDLLASLLYWENWHQIFSGSSYFADQGLPLLRHLWSLAVEEQFYLAWPVVAAVCLSFRRTRIWIFLAISLGLAGLSGLMAHRLADPFNASALQAAESLNRVYLGTDTRALGLLLGALLAMILSITGAGKRSHRWVGTAIDLSAFLALAGLFATMAMLDIQTPWLYRGGFLWVDGLTLIILFSLVAPSASRMQNLLGWRPLEWIGKRSYGLYLWHWPVFRLLRPDRGGLPSLALSVLLAFVLTELSYRLIEQPIRLHGFMGWFRAVPGGPGWRPWAVRGATLLLGSTTVVGCIALAERPDYVDPVAAAIQAGAQALDKPSVPQEPGQVIPLPQAEAPLPVLANLAPAPIAGIPPLAPVPEVIPLPEELKDSRITAIGDSVMKGAALAFKRLGESSLGKGRLVIDAEECRSFTQALPLLRAYKADGRLGDTVVIHLGTNNSSLQEEAFGRLMTFLADRRIVIFLTAKSDKLSACERVNQNLRTFARGYPNAKVLDWKEAMDLHPECFYSDTTHLRAEGTVQYASFILTGLAGAMPRPSVALQNSLVPTLPLAGRAR